MSEDDPLRISAVSFINTLPFIYGLRNSNELKNYRLSLDVPSLCAAKLINGEADLGLIPVAAIPQLPSSHILPGYCIGANGNVKTVLMHSQVPLKEIGNVVLDSASRTSNDLLKILAHHHWKISPAWLNQEAVEKQHNTARLVIGDRNFQLQGEYQYTYDLAGEWKMMTGLPFVFACWVSVKKLGETASNKLQRSFAFGLDHLSEAIEGYQGPVAKAEIEEYLKSSIDFVLDKEKLEAMNLFFKMQKELNTTKSSF